MLEITAPQSAQLHIPQPGERQTFLFFFSPSTYYLGWGASSSPSSSSLSMLCTLFIPSSFEIIHPDEQRSLGSVFEVYLIRLSPPLKYPLYPF